MKRLLFAVSLLAVAQTTPARQPDGPPMPYVERGGCPFEGCVYRDWTALRSVAALDYPAGTWERNDPASGLKQGFTVSPGEVVTGMTGVVVVTAPGHARSKARRAGVMNPEFPKAVAPDIDLAAGDIVYLLSYHGEGFFTAWAKGQLTTFSDVDDGTVIDPPKFIWWVEIRNARGEIGWTTDTGAFTNMDAFGGPLEPTKVVNLSFAERSWSDLRPGIHIKPFVGESGTFVLAEFDPGAQTPMHHHTHEQINVGLSGDLEISIAGHSRALTTTTATLVPADADHSIINKGSQSARLLEFQPIRRFDLLPPRPAPSYPVGAEATLLTAAQLHAVDFGDSGATWTTEPSGIRTRTLSGVHAGLTVIDVPAAFTGSVNLRPQPEVAEQFVYVLRGNVTITVGKEGAGNYQVGTTDALELPPNTSVQMRLNSSADARLLRFDVR